MPSPAFRRVLARATRRNVQRMATNMRLGLKRGMASSTEPAKSSDLPWIIGSGTVTALGLSYVLSPPSKKHAHHAAKAAKAPIEQALPKQEEEKSEPQIMKDDEGKEEDVTESQRIAFETDAPKDAQAHEEAVARFEEGAPGQTEDVGKAEQEEKPAETNRAGTTQDKPEGPSGMGDARKEAKEHNAPKQAADKTEP